jgi:hypothetical protein
MFARWCQENFFRYMHQHYNLDRLAEYGVEAVPDTTRRNEDADDDGNGTDGH